MQAGGVDIYFIHPDHLDSPRAVVNANDQPIWLWDSAPFGDTAANEQPTAGLASFTFNLRFPGQQYDRETGTHYNYFRDYEAGTGRYVQSDRLGLFDGMNTFSYATASPVEYSDPTGEAVCTGRLKLLGLCKPKRTPRAHRPNLRPPPGGGLYVARDCDGNVVYAGQTNNFRSRSNAHWGANGQFNAFNNKCCPISVHFTAKASGPGLDSLERKVVAHHRPPGNTNFNPKPKLFKKSKKCC